MTVTTTPYSIVDATGKALCHSPNQSKRNADATRKREVAAQFAAMVAAAGMATTDGMVQDVVTGAWLPMATDAGDRTDLSLVERGHVVADEHDGPLCPCNLVPEVRASNRAHGKRDLDPNAFRTVDPRYTWRAVWLATAKASKVRRAV